MHGNARPRFALPAGIAMAALVLSVPAPAARDATREALPDEAVVATFRGGEITAGRLRELVGPRALQSEDSAQLLQYAEEALRSEAANQVLLQEALAAGLAEKPEVRLVLDYQREMEAAREMWSTRQQADVQPPTEEELRAYYEAHKEEELAQPTRYSFRHIFFDTHRLEGQAAKAALRATAEKVLALARGGGDFAQLAAAYSQGAGGKDVLGPLPAGDISPVLDHAILSATKGAILGVLETKFGYHIIQVEELLPADYRPLEAVKEDLRRRLTRERQAAFRERMEEWTCEGPGVVYRPDLLAATAEANAGAAIGTAERTWTRDELRQEARAIGNENRLDGGPGEYALQRLLIRRLYEEAAAERITEATEFRARWEAMREAVLRDQRLKELLAGGPGEPTTAEVDAELRENAERYMGPEKSHILLLKLVAAVTPEMGRGTRYVAIEDRKIELEALVAPVQSGEKRFAAVLEQALGRVPGATGADLGYVSYRDVEDPEVRRHLAGLRKAGDMTPVEIAYDDGYAYVVYCADVRPPEMLPVEEARERAASALRRQKESDARKRILDGMLDRADFRLVEGWSDALQGVGAP